MSVKTFKGSQNRIVRIHNDRVFEMVKSLASDIDIPVQHVFNQLMDMVQEVVLDTKPELKTRLTPVTPKPTINDYMGDIKRFYAELNEYPHTPFWTIDNVPLYITETSDGKWYLGIVPTGFVTGLFLEKTQMELVDCLEKMVKRNGNV